MAARSWRSRHQVWASAGSVPQLGQPEANIATCRRTGCWLGLSSGADAGVAGGVSVLAGAQPSNSVPTWVMIVRMERTPNSKNDN